MRHHDAALETFVERCQHDDTVLAVILTGSVARGDARADSDVDLVLVVTEEAFDRALAEQRVMYVETEGVDYEGGYLDIKVASVRYLDAAATRADDPTRASFESARVAWARGNDFEERIAAIGAVPEHVWEGHILSFLAQARLHGGYFLEQAVDQSNELLLRHAALHLATSAARVLLAENRILFAGPKYLEKAIAALPQKPDGFGEAIHDLLAAPDRATAARVIALLEGFRDWPLAEARTLSTFVRDNELAWFAATVPPEYS